MSLMSMSVDTSIEKCLLASENNSSETNDTKLMVAEIPDQTEHIEQACLPGSSKSFKSYSREELLKIKERRFANWEPDETVLLAFPKTVFKILKPECKILQRKSKSQDNGGIILGPQKRSWNIGCHVSQSKSSHNEVSCSKGKKSFPENKSSRADGKRDSKTTDKTSGRLSFNSNSGYSRCAIVAKGDATTKSDSLKVGYNVEKEPEWFTDGPETINDTVELGKIIEDCDPNDKSPKNDYFADPPPKPSDIDSAVLSVNESDVVASQASATQSFIEADFLQLLDKHKKKNEGSRLRHLFEKTNTSSDNTINDNVTSKLLKLLASSGDGPPPQGSSPQIPPSQLSEKDLESALKSLLFGNYKQKSEGISHHKPLFLDPVVRMPTTSLGMASAPTVKEIEAAAFSSGDGSFVPKPAHTKTLNLLNSWNRPFHFDQQIQTMPSDLTQINQESIQRCGNVPKRPTASHDISNWNASFSGVVPANSPDGRPFPSSPLLSNYMISQMHHAVNRQVYPDSGFSLSSSASNQSYCRPIVKSLSMMDSVTSTAAQSPNYRPLYLNNRCPPPMASSDVNIKATLLQLQKALGNPAPAPPTSSPFSPSHHGATCPPDNLRSASTEERDLMAYGHAQLKHIGSAPNLLFPVNRQSTLTGTNASSLSVPTINPFHTAVTREVGGTRHTLSDLK